MSDETKDGGAAFPTNGYGDPEEGYCGMRLSDYFAGQVMMGMMSAEDHEALGAAEMAGAAYALADAMLAARSRRQAEAQSSDCDLPGYRHAPPDLVTNDGVSPLSQAETREDGHMGRCARCGWSGVVCSDFSLCQSCSAAWLDSYKGVRRG